MSLACQRPCLFTYHLVRVRQFLPLSHLCVEARRADFCNHFMEFLGNLTLFDMVVDHDALGKELANSYRSITMVTYNNGSNIHHNEDLVKSQL